MKRIQHILLLIIVLIIIAIGHPFRPFYVFFQEGYNDTAYVDTTDACIPCSTSYNVTICTTAVISSLPIDTTDDTLWHGYLLKLWIKDTSGYTSDTFYVNDTCFRTLYQVVPCNIAPTCSLVWGYHFWVINLDCINIQYGIYVGDGDSVCVYIGKDMQHGQKCVAINSSTPVHQLRVIAGDTTPVYISEFPVIPYPAYSDTYWYDIRGRRTLPYRSGVYLHRRRVIVIIK